LERLVGGPHAVRDHGKLADNRDAFLAPMRLPKVSPQVFSAPGRADRSSNTGLEQKAAHRLRTLRRHHRSRRIDNAWASSRGTHPDDDRFGRSSMMLGAGNA